MGQQWARTPDGVALDSSELVNRFRALEAHCERFTFRSHDVLMDHAQILDDIRGRAANAYTALAAIQDSLPDVLRSINLARDRSERTAAHSENSRGELQAQLAAFDARLETVMAQLWPR